MIRKFLGGLLLLCALWLPGRALGVGTWTPLASQPGQDEIGLCLLLSDGTILAQGATTAWYQLKPDNQGHYVHGTWSTLHSSQFNQNIGSTAVLTNGNVFVGGGENNNGSSVIEIYNPVSGSWSVANNGTLNIADGNGMLMPDGRVLIEPQGIVNGSIDTSTYLFNPGNNTISQTTGAPLHGIEEATWVKLPNDNVLVIDSGNSEVGATTAEMYNPNTGTWINAASGGTVPNIWPNMTGAGAVSEMGPAFLLPNGNAIFFGGNGATAVYDNGTWFPSATLPAGLGQKDAPGAMMINGKILLAVSPQGTNSSQADANGIGPTSFYEYDYTANSGAGGFTLAPAINDTNITDYCAAYLTMLDLPDGTVLLASAVNNQLYIYTPDGSPLPAGKPTIQSISVNGDGSLHLTGTLFNGISQGASFGDDEQMDSNYPLVRFTDASGTVRYGRSYNWSNTGVMKTSLTVTTECTLPAGASLGDTIQVVANGIASEGHSTVTNLNDSGPGSLRQAIANDVAGAYITFATNLAGATILLTNGALITTNNLTIDASALPGGITLNGNHGGRIFEIAGGTTGRLTALTLTNGYSTGSGGAVLNRGVLSLNNCTLAGNSTASGFAGGAIANSNLLTLTGCTFSGNGGGFGGAILNQGSVCTAQNCTFAGNAASTGNGGAIDNAGSDVLNLLHCTFAGNTAGSHGGDIYNSTSQVYLTNTISAASTPDDIYNAVGSTNTAGGSNIVQVLVNAGTLIGTNTVRAVNPQLAPLGNYGGPTWTQPPMAGSPAIDAASFTTLLTDQRGYPRVVGPAPDLGAVEFQASPIVATAADSGIGSLRYINIYTTNGAYITFVTNLSGATIQSSGTLTLNKSLTIDASALPGGITINGNQAGPVFLVTNGNVVLTGLTITNGNAPSPGGGGGIINYAVLTLNQCTLAGNSSELAGGILNDTGTLVVNQSTLAGNSGGAGGGIYNFQGTVTVNQSTLMGNSGSDGGGILNLEGSLTVNQSTLTGNSDPSGAAGGLYNFDELGSVTLYNSIVAGNSLPNTSGYDSQTSATTSGITTQTGASLTNGTPLLAPLANYGGPTPTMPPLPGSPAIDSCTNGTTFTTDQRGYPRSLGRAADIGAVEGVHNPAGPGKLKNVTKLGNGSVSFTLTNYSDMSFTVLASSNLALPFSQWSNVGTALESPPGSGQYPFTDLQATNSSRRFYTVASP